MTVDYANPWFWRIQTQLEIDYAEEQDRRLSAFKFDGRYRTEHHGNGHERFL